MKGIVENTIEQLNLAPHRDEVCNEPLFSLMKKKFYVG